jgi:hypothetical protein
LKHSVFSAEFSSGYICITKIVSFSSQAAVEEGIVVGGGCTLLRLAAKVDAIKDTLENDEQKVKTKSAIP